MFMKDSGASKIESHGNIPDKEWAINDLTSAKESSKTRRILRVAITARIKNKIAVLVSYKERYMVLQRSDLQPASNVMVVIINRVFLNRATYREAEENNNITQKRRYETTKIKESVQKKS
jgi:hypothetical protein